MAAGLLGQGSTDLEHRGYEIFFPVIISAISGQPLSAQARALYDPALLPGMTALARRHDLTHLLALGLKNNGPLDEQSRELETEMFRAAFRCEQLSYELERICRTFEDAQIPFIPLKGSVLRPYYPEPWMRTSCDIDVLVREQDLDRAIAALSKTLSYQIGEISLHDVQIRTPNGQHIELHRNLIEDHRVNRAAEVLASVWDTAAPRSGWTYWLEMPDELFYFYHIAHMAKHLDNGGCGIRPFLDIWVLTHRVPYDPEKRKQLLADGGLTEFASQAERLTEVWFGAAAHDDATRRLERYILIGGVYGTADNKLSVQQARSGGKLRYACSRIWLPYEKLKTHYPSLDGRPALLPLYEIYRWGRLLFCGGVTRSVTELRINNSIGKERAEEAGRLFSELGLHKDTEKQKTNANS